MKWVRTLLDEVLLFLRDRLNADLNAGLDTTIAREDLVTFVDGEAWSPLTFRLGAISLLLVNLEEEKTLRSPDRYQRPRKGGVAQPVQPEIHLNLYVLFVAHFKQYDETLRYLTRIIQYFQLHPLFEPGTEAALSEQLAQLSLELITLPFAEQNELWSALKVAYHPSVMYKVKMALFATAAGVGAPPVREQMLKLAPLPAGN